MQIKTKNIRTLEQIQQNSHKQWLRWLYQIYKRLHQSQLEFSQTMLFSIAEMQTILEHEKKMIELINEYVLKPEKQLFLKYVRKTMYLTRGERTEEEIDKIIDDMIKENKIDMSIQIAVDLIEEYKKESMEIKETEIELWFDPIYIEKINFEILEIYNQLWYNI